MPAFFCWIFIQWGPIVGGSTMEFKFVVPANRLFQGKQRIISGN